MYNKDVAKIKFEGEDFSSVKAVSTVIPGGAREATEEQMRQAEAKEANKKPPIKEADEGGIMPLTDWYFLDVPYYAQEEKMSCGPACARMVLEYLTGNSYTEKTIREDERVCYSSEYGTYLADLVTYINDEQSRTEYQVFFKKSYDTMKNHIYNAIAIYSMPVIIGVKASASMDLIYGGDGGHFLTVYECSSDMEYVSVCNPWAGFVGENHNSRYTVPTKGLFDGYNAINSGYAY